jgi:hypothetical protein
MSEEDKIALRDAKIAEASRERAALASNGTELRMAQVTSARSRQNEVMMLKVPSAARGSLPGGLGALEPNDIATVDVSKHADGTVAPKAVSIVTITLKPGAKMPSARTR